MDFFKCYDLVLMCSVETKNVHGIEQFRKDRLKIMAVKEDYSKASHLAMGDVRCVGVAYYV